MWWSPRTVAEGGSASEPQAAGLGLRCAGTSAPVDATLTVAQAHRIAHELVYSMSRLAAVAVDHFHVVQLANTMLSMVRRRTTAEVRGRHRRATAPECEPDVGSCATGRTSPTSTSATPTTNAYGHAASRPAEPADTSAPLNFEGPLRQIQTSRSSQLT
ncbi:MULTISPECIES: transposase [unclassified Streptomyces]|uniref:transposase n=1 Tax=unclassified Streptomyces TaxID=2593676 RepID=UPI00336AC748